MEVKNDTLEVLGGDYSECSLCGVQWYEKDMEFHHTSYSNNKGVFLCYDCHYKVHYEEGFYDNLKPGEKRRESDGVVLDPNDYSVAVSLMPSSYRDLSESAESHGISPQNTVRVGVQHLIEYGDGDVINGIKKLKERID